MSDDTAELSPDRIAAFLADLSELSRRHGILIAGCGCCGSPFLDAIGPAELTPGYRYVARGERDLEWKDKP